MRSRAHPDDRGPRWVALGRDGLVPCPTRAWGVDLRRCLACERLVDLDRVAEPWALRCRAAPCRTPGRPPEQVKQRD